MRTIFIRHGLAESNIAPLDRIVGAHSELVDEGVEQIQAVATKLGELAASQVIYSSPYVRTRESAEIIAQVLNVDVEYDDRLREIYKGILEGRSVEQAIEFEAGIDIDRRHLESPEGGENWLDVGQRMADFIEEKFSKGAEELIIISHDHPIRMGIGRLMKREPVTWEDLELDNGSITILEHDGDGWRLVPEYTNWTPEET